MCVEVILKAKGRSVVTVRHDQTIAQAALVMATNDIGAMVVCDGRGKIMGILSERDITRGMARFGKTIHTMHVRNLMSTKVTTCRPGDSVNAAMTLMDRHRIRHLPVVEGEQIKGIISIRDVIHQRLTEKQTEVEILRDRARVAV